MSDHDKYTYTQVQECFRRLRENYKASADDHEIINRTFTYEHSFFEVRERIRQEYERELKEQMEDIERNVSAEQAVGRVVMRLLAESPDFSVQRLDRLLIDWARERERRWAAHESKTEGSGDR